MQVFHSLEDIARLPSPRAVAIGNFDGVHMGHQALLKSLVVSAKEKHLVPTVLTFYPHPIQVLNPSVKLERLTSTEEKLSLLDSLGVEQVLVAPFDTHVAKLSPEEFFENFLVKALSSNWILVGDDFSFGFKRRGNTELLSRLCSQRSIALHIEAEVNIPRLNSDTTRVSSSLIRRLLQDGEIKAANLNLGRPYFLTGVVIEGDSRGRLLGFPTANIQTPADKLLPLNGVYITELLWQRQRYRSITNVGVRPTFDANSFKKVVETHIFDFNAKIYDETVRLEFLDFLREEKKFAGIEELKKQIEMDISRAKKFNI